MNFFGHAAVAAWAPEATPAFVLGAMLLSEYSTPSTLIIGAVPAAPAGLRCAGLGA